MSAKELLDRYSEFLNKTSLDPKVDFSTEPTLGDLIPNSQVIDQLLPIIGFCIYLGFRLLGSVLSWVSRWRLFRRFKKTATLHSIYYTMVSSTVSGKFVKIIIFHLKKFKIIVKNVFHV